MGIDFTMIENIKRKCNIFCAGSFSMPKGFFSMRFGSRFHRLLGTNVGGGYRFLGRIGQQNHTKILNVKTET